MRVFHYVGTYGMFVNSSFWYCFSIKYLVLFGGLYGVDENIQLLNVHCMHVTTPLQFESSTHSLAVCCGSH